MATTGLATIGTAENLGTLLKAWRPRLAQIYGEGEEATGRFLAVVDACVRRNPDLKNCTVDSFRTAIENAAALKLLPTGLMNLGWIIPFGKEATFVAGYRGLLDVAYRSGRIAGYDVGLVHKTDEYRYIRGLDLTLEHTPRFQGVFSYEDRAALVAGYATWWDVLNGQKIAQRQVWLWHEQIERLRKKSKMADSGPWRTDYHPMALKAIVRASTALMPLTPEQDALLARAYETEDEQLGMEKTIDITPNQPAATEPGRAEMFPKDEE